MMVASRFNVFSLSSEGLMTTAFPAEHMESGWPHLNALPPPPVTKPGDSLHLLCPPRSE